MNTKVLIMLSTVCCMLRVFHNNWKTRMLHTFRHSENFTVVLKKKQMRRGKVYENMLNIITYEEDTKYNNNEIPLCTQKNG